MGLEANFISCLSFRIGKVQIILQRHYTTMSLPLYGRPDNHLEWTYTNICLFFFAIKA